MQGFSPIAVHPCTHRDYQPPADSRPSFHLICYHHMVVSQIRRKADLHGAARATRRASHTDVASESPLNSRAFQTAHPQLTLFRCLAGVFARRVNF